MKKLPQCLIFLALTLFTASTYAQTAVIVHPETVTIKKLNVNRAYLGYAKKFPGGYTMQVLDQPKGSARRDVFYRAIVRKTPSQIIQHWSRLTSHKKGRPPLVLNDELAILTAVASTPGAIGYIDEALVDSSVKVVFTLP